MYIPLTVKFEFDDPGVRKGDLEFDGKTFVLLPLVGDWVQPDTYHSIPREVIRRTFQMGLQSTTLILRCK